MHNVNEFARRHNKFLRPKYALILLFISICYYIYTSRRQKRMKSKMGSRAIGEGNDENEALRDLQGYMGTTGAGERGLLSDMAKKYFGEMDVENLLAG